MESTLSLSPVPREMHELKAKSLLASVVGSLGDQIPMGKSEAAALMKSVAQGSQPLPKSPVETVSWHKNYLADFYSLH